MYMASSSLNVFKTQHVQVVNKHNKRWHTCDVNSAEVINSHYTVQQCNEQNPKVNNILLVFSFFLGHSVHVEMNVE